MYNFPFAVDGPYSDGDVPTWNDTTKRWEAQPGGGGGSSTWAEVLVEGNSSGANTPVISGGEALAFADGEGGVQGTLELDIDNSQLTLSTIDNANGILITSDGGVEINTPESQAGVAASDIHITGGDSNEGAGNIELTAGSATAADRTGGHINVIAGAGGGGETGSGGPIRIRAGAPDGPLLIQHENEETAILITGAPVSVLGSAAVVINDTGLAFWDGTPAIRPSVTDLPTLLAALDAMGLITDDS